MDFESIRRFGINTFNFDENFLKGLENPTVDSLKAYIKELADKKYIEKEEEFGDEKFREIERVALLQNVDQKWMDHIDAMDQLRKGIWTSCSGTN